MTIRSWNPWLRPLGVAFVGAIATGAGVWLAALAEPRPPALYDTDSRVSRSPDNPVEVNPQRPLQIPFDFGDFDLYATVELSEDTELDLLFRKVEPKRRDGDMPLFHGRFGVLRLSTRAEGPAVRSREQALFDDESNGGRLIDAGLAASIKIEGRGRRVRINVAGVWEPWFETVDAHGNFAFTSRGGKALVRLLEVRHVARAAALPAWGWGCVLGWFVGLLLSRRVRTVWSFIVVPALGYLAGRLVLSHVVAESETETIATLLAGACGLPLFVALARPMRWFAMVLAAVIGLACLEVVVRTERPRMTAFEDPRLDLYLGWGSSTAPADALEGRLRGRAAVSTSSRVPVRVIFAGGGPLWESGDLPQFLGPLAAAAAARELGKRVDGVVVPTVYSHTLQQLLLLERFYLTDFRPDVVVFGIPPWEADPSERAAPYAVLDGEAVRPSGFGSILVELWRRAAGSGDVPPAGETALRRTLTALGRSAERHGFEVLLVDAPELPVGLRAVVDAAVAAHGFAHRRATWVIGGDVDVQGLADRLVELLR